MKFTAFVIASLATVASADFNLRATANKLLGTKKSAEFSDARVVVHGLIHETTADDMKIISKSIVAAYNKAYESTGHSIELFEPQSAASVADSTVSTKEWECRNCPPDDDSMVEESSSQSELVLARVQAGEWECRVCPPDDDSLESLQSKGSKLGDVHKSFEESFCEKLRNSGSANLANARGCAFAFLDMPGEKVDNLPGSSSEGEAQIVLQGTLHDFTSTDYAILDSSVVAAYNEAFTSAGLKLGSVQSVGELAVSPLSVKEWECRNCPPDDDSMVDMSNQEKLVLARVGEWECRQCPPDDDTMMVAESNTAALLSDQQLAYMHVAFEKAMCSKLRNSGSANFANVHDCSFRFVYSPAAVAETVEQ